MLITRIKEALKAVIWFLRGSIHFEANDQPAAKSPLHGPPSSAQDEEAHHSATVVRKTPPLPPVSGAEPIGRKPGDGAGKDDHPQNESTSDMVHKPSDSDAVRPESDLSNTGKAGQPPPKLDDGRHRLPDISSAASSEDCQSSPPKENGYADDRKPEVDDISADSPREQPRTTRRPREIGGRRGAQAQSPRLKGEYRRASRPELVCRRVLGTGKWEVVLSVDDDCRLAAVKHDGELLKFSNQECPLPSLIGHLVVSCQDGQELDIPLTGVSPLIFKLRKNWNGKGRRISALTRGHFIVIAPDAWERIGRVPVEPDSCTHEGFRAHYFYRSAMAQDKEPDGFRGCDVLPQASGIKLKGEIVFDDSDEGALFVGDAPVLQSSPDIAWARVGEEAKQGWKGENFEPASQSLSDILHGKNGHFFLRVYDAHLKLLDSTEFRCLHSLKRICVNGVQYTEETGMAPRSSGYPPTQVRFEDADGALISPVLPSETIHKVSPLGILDVPRKPDADRISCTLESDVGSVKSVLDLPRIWWRVKQGCGDTGAWRDTPLVMTRQEFRNRARKNAEICVLSKRYSAIRVGFDNEPYREFHRKTAEDYISIPLAEFDDYRQIDQRLNEDTHLNVEWAGKILPITRISADSIPAIISFEVHPTSVTAGETAMLCWVTKNANANRVEISPGVGSVSHCGKREVKRTSNTTFRLTLSASGHDDLKQECTLIVRPRRAKQRVPGALVKRSGDGGFREGKGFSQREYEASGLTFQELMQILDRGFFIDTRRRTVHQANIDMLRRLRGA